jgi:hypothetical protein
MEVDNKEVKTYTQEEVDQMQAEHKAAMEARVEDARQKIAAADRKAEVALGLVNPDAFLAAQQAADNAAAVERASLNKYFGVGSSSKLANDLAREQPELYRSLKAKAQACGLIGKPEQLPKLGSKAFGPI